jgi:iron complex outermembrane recepter protein
MGYRIMTTNRRTGALAPSLLLAATALAGCPVVAHAGDTASAAPAAAAEGSGDGAPALDTIVVTAQRRKESMQTVPIAINSISGETLQKSGYQSLTDLQYMTPGLTFDPTQGSAFQIRGVGSTSFDMSNAKSVSVVVDDVVMDAQRDLGITGLVDIDRVDVLMGPQGTLFGNTSTSGVISISTAKPKLHEFSGKVYASYGERNDRMINGIVNVPLGDTLALRVTAFDDGQDGKGEYTTLHRNLGRVDEFGVRGKLLWAPSDDLEVILAGEYTHHYDTSVRTAVGGPAGTSFAPTAAVTAAEIANGVTPGPQNASTADSFLGTIVTANKGGSLHVSYKLGNNTLTSITAYRQTKYDNNTPADLLPADEYSYFSYNMGTLSSQKFSEEIHFASPTGGLVEYLVGGIYNRLSATQNQIQWGTEGTGPLTVDGTVVSNLYANTGANDPVTGQLLGNSVAFNSHNETLAAFGQLKFNPTRRFSIALGGRYNYDRNDQRISYPTVDPVALTGREITFTATGTAPTADYRYGVKTGRRFTYRIAPTFQLNKDVMLYASYATGYKPGGIAFVGNKYDPYEQETVKSWEVGEKAEFWNHRLRVNFDLFTSKYSDFQATILTPVSSGVGGFILTSAIGNAPGLRSRGFEAQVAVKPTRSLSFSGAVTYADAIFTNYVASSTANYTGTNLTNAPKWTANIATDYDAPITPKFDLKAHLEFVYRSSLQTVTGALLGNITAPARVNGDGTTTPNASYSYVPGYGLVNGRITLARAGDKYEVGAYVRNLFNQYFSTGWQIYGSLGLLHYTSPDAYRTVGVFAQMKF